MSDTKKASPHTQFAPSNKRYKMVELFSDFFNWLAALPTGWMYVMLFVIAYGENVLPPIPGDMVIVFGGYMAARGVLNFPLVVLICILGGALGFMSMFYPGWRAGDAAVDPKRMRWIPKTQVQKAKAWLQKYGYGIIAVNRFLSGMRSVIALTAGIARMRPWPVCFYATLSATVWTILIAYMGYVVGDNWQVIGEWLRLYGRVVFWITVAGLAVYWGWRWRKRRKTAAQQEV